jgi:hypothetical protein
MSLIYDNEYNNKISNSLINLTKLKEYNNQPTRFNYSGAGININRYDRVVGGMIPINSENRLDKPIYYTKPASGGEYIQPGTNAAYPNYNSIELNNINGGAKSGGSFLSSAIGLMKPFVKPIISKSLDVVVPMAVKRITGENVVGNAASDVARSITGSLTGYGMNAGVGNYETTQTAKKYAKKSGGKIKKNKKLEDLTNVISNLELGKPTETIKSTPKKNIKNRMELVKKIMKEKNMNLPSASKYIKENNLY